MPYRSPRLSLAARLALAGDNCMFICRRESATDPRNLDAGLSTGASAAPDHPLALHGPLEGERFLIGISFRTLRIDQLQINKEA